MPTVPTAGRRAHPSAPRPGDWLAADLAPVAAQLAGTLRDYDLADVHGVLADVPEQKRTDLILVLAAMVDPDATPAELLAWTRRPAESRDAGDWRTLPASKQRGACHLCGKVMRRDKIGRHQRAMHADTVGRAA